MKITYNDLMNPNTVAFNMLQKLEDERRTLEKRADRLRKMDIALTSLIQEGRITDTEEISCAIAWLNNSDLEVYEIINKIF